ncbi:MAG: AbrB/MazE/SpoVT family DNA-binding domain-containing protein [Blastocatellia bacterium]
MVITQLKLTDQNAVIPIEILRRLGAGPGSVLEWEEDGEQIIVRRADGHTSEDIHLALFSKPPKNRRLKEMKLGIKQHIKERYARG